MLKKLGELREAIFNNFYSLLVNTITAVDLVACYTRYIGWALMYEATLIFYYRRALFSFRLYA